MADYTDGEHGLWLVVPPSVGLPLFLGTVTLIAVLVHAALLSNTKWFPKYWEGGAKVASTAPATTAPTVR
jgi:light-harvesting protein B-800-850 alpha chain